MPLALAVSVWDGTVSTLRIDELDALHELAADLPGWRWTHGTFEYGGVGRGTWCSGVRR